MDKYFFTAIFSAFIGVALGWVFYKYFIEQKFTKNKDVSRHAKVYSWCGKLSSYAIVVGAGRIANEYLLSAFAELSVRELVIIQGIFTIVFFPIIFFLLGFLISKFIHDGKFSLETPSNLSNTAPVSTQAELRKTIILVSVILAFFFISSKFLNGSGQIFGSSNSFTSTSCIRCVDSKCDNDDFLQEFKVLEKSVQLSLKSNGVEKLINIPEHFDEMKCAISKEKNFMFNCDSIRVHNGSFSTTYIAFDGSNKFIWNNYISMRGIEAKETKISCKLN